jgi:hypothetical protein
MAKRGNPGYGKSEMIRQNVDKFSPVFWQLMEELSKSRKAEDKRLFITEFNKLQVKMIPTEVGGINGEPISITWMSQSPTPQEPGQTSST